MEAHDISSQSELDQRFMNVDLSADNNVFAYFIFLCWPQNSFMYWSEVEITWAWVQGWKHRKDNNNECICFIELLSCWLVLSPTPLSLSPSLSHSLSIQAFCEQVTVLILLSIFFLCVRISYREWLNNWSPQTCAWIKFAFVVILFSIYCNENGCYVFIKNRWPWGQKLKLKDSVAARNCYYAHI